MIITKINGGLGNQLFQYAAGRALAQHHQTELALDLSWFKNMPVSNTERKFELHNYPIRARIVNAQEVSKLRFYHGRLIRRIPFLPRPWFHAKEKSFAYDPQFLSLPDDVYLDGYWQSNLYFEEIGDLVRSDLQPLNDPSGRDAELLAKIREQNSVALHIRRGDYITNSSATNYHGICSLDYYQEAVKTISARVVDPHFYIFSDDLEWVKKNLNINFPMNFIGHNQGDQAFQDIRLISNCKHQIIANSSFSWWGAWLNPNANKIVIAPKKWFLVNKDTSTLYPDGWVKL